MTISVGIAFANSGPFAQPEAAAALARTAEEHGVESLWTVEHVIVPVGYTSTYPYHPKGRMLGEELDIPDPLIWLAYVAGQTSSIKLGTGILILPQRNPIVTAKEIATLDLLSGGRVQLGVGVGWLEEEFDALGVPFAERGRRTDEHIEVMRALWSGRASFDGEFTRFGEAIAHPVPAQGQGVPIVIGGHTPIAARRAGRLGDGFFPAKGSVDELGVLVEVMRETAAAAGRNPDEIELTTGARDLDGMKRLHDIGFTRFVAPPPAYDIAQLPAAFARLQEELVGPLASI
ncbi:MAG TPA: LLM class F420-dependent oxidoreductase [Actinomycetota bacterium]